MITPENEVIDDPKWVTLLDYNIEVWEDFKNLPFNTISERWQVQFVKSKNEKKEIYIYNSLEKIEWLEETGEFYQIFIRDTNIFKKELSMKFNNFIYNQNINILKDLIDKKTLLNKEDILQSIKSEHFIEKLDIKKLEKSFKRIDFLNDGNFYWTLTKWYLYAFVPKKWKLVNVKLNEDASFYELDSFDKIDILAKWKGVGKVMQLWSKINTNMLISWEDFIISQDLDSILTDLKK